jgi:exodeoxyribonuclease-1
MSFVFYDTETTGLDTAFSQVLQFGAIKTDDDLEEVGRFEIRSRLLPYVVPSPRALHVTGLTIDQLLDEAHPTHYEMVSEIHRTLGQECPAVFIGYNSMRFDEELLRQAFYQCLYPPYLTNTGGSRRADGIHLLRAAAAIYPNSIVVPLNAKGRPSFRLEHLAPANGMNFLNAHDAMADVEALIFLCRLIKERCPDLWARFLKFASKPAVEDFLRREDAFLLLEFFPTSTGKFIATAIGSNNANVAYCYDLAIDPGTLGGLSDEALAKRLQTSPRPIRKVRKNAAPSLCPLGEAPPEVLGELSPEEYGRRARELRSDRPLVERLVAAMDGLEEPFPPSPHVERQIYDGFWSNADASRLQAFHRASWEERVIIADNLEDPRLKWLARRLVFVERPHLLAPEHHAAIAGEKARRMMADGSESGGWTTLLQASAELQGLLAELDGDAAEAFVRLGAYYEGQSRKSAGVLTSLDR